VDNIISFSSSFSYFTLQEKKKLSYYKTPAR